MKVYVICNNDSIEYAVIGDEKKAEAIKEHMKVESIEEYKKNYPYEYENSGEPPYFWHIHEVVCEGHAEQLLRITDDHLEYVVGVVLGDEDALDIGGLK
ncbi:MAG: hypothetical protein PVG39_02480 [Desulfobacteraceae bacterium]|jgi:hypothetical protein